jgi:hypothetical protein
MEELAAEVSKLRAAAREFESEKKALEAQLLEQKQKYDHVVAKMRSHLI